MVAVGQVPHTAHRRRMRAPRPILPWGYPMSHARRLAAAAVATTLAGGALSLGSTSAATPAGISTATAGTSVLRVQLGSAGSLLGVRVLGDDSRSTIDPKVASVSSAFTRLAPLDVTSAVLPALKLSLPNVEAKSPGGQPSVSTQAVALSSPASSGSLDPASLSAAVANGEATSALSSALKNVSLVGGLVSVP